MNHFSVIKKAKTEEIFITTYDTTKLVAFLHALQSSTQEFFLICSSLSRLGLELQALLPAVQSQIRSSLLRSLLLDTPDLLAPAHGFLKVLNEKAAK